MNEGRDRFIDLVAEFGLEWILQQVSIACEVEADYVDCEVVDEPMLQNVIKWKQLGLEAASLAQRVEEHKINVATYKEPQE